MFAYAVAYVAPYAIAYTIHGPLTSGPCTIALPAAYIVANVVS